MSISDLLTSQRRWGHTRCRKFLQSILMSENKTIGSMTDRQRRAVAELLRAGWAAEFEVDRVESFEPVLVGVA